MSRMSRSSTSFSDLLQQHVAKLARLTAIHQEEMGKAAWTGCGAAIRQCATEPFRTFLLAFVNGEEGRI